MNLVFVCTSLLFLIYHNSCDIRVDAKPTAVLSRGRMMENPRLFPVQLEDHQHSLSEFSEDNVTEKPKSRRKKAKKKKNTKRKRIQNKDFTKKNRKKFKKNARRTVKVIKDDRKSPVDIIVHIKMNE